MALPELLGCYRRTRLIRKGPTSAVWLAKRVDQPESKQRFALKVPLSEYRADADIIRRLRHEYKVTRTQDHPGLIRAFECGTSGTVTFLALEYFRSKSIATLLRHDQTDTLLSNIVAVMDHITDALHHLHRSGWVHCDVKPDNMLVNQVLDFKLIDFAISMRVGSRLRSSPLSRSRSLSGTLSYMSPEQIRGEKLDARSDIYSLGCTLHELLSGKTPYSGTSANDVLSKHLKAPVPPLLIADSHVSHPLSEALSHMLAKSPEDRPPTMLHVFAVLRPFLAQLQSERSVLPRMVSLQPHDHSEEARESQQTSDVASDTSECLEANTPATTTEDSQDVPDTRQQVLVQSAEQQQPERIAISSTQRVLATGRTLVRSRTLWAASAATAASLLLLLFVLSRMPPSAEAVGTRFAQLTERATALRERDAPDSDWLALERSAEEAVTHAQPLLRRADASRPDLLELNWAADLLPRAIADRRANSTLAVDKLGLHLDRFDEHSQRRVEHSTRRQYSWFHLSTLVYAAVVVFDVAVVLWLLSLLRARVRARAAS